MRLLIDTSQSIEGGVAIVDTWTGYLYETDFKK